MTRTMDMYGGKVHGVEVSKYGLECGYLDYKTLAALVGDMILNNTILEMTELDSWTLACGKDFGGLDNEGYECEPDSDECVDVNYYTVYQTYIISERGYKFLRDYTDEIVYYNDEIDIYLWGVCHLGTSWDYVLTDIKLKEVL